MQSLQFTFFYFVLYIFSGGTVLEYPSATPAKITKSITGNAATTHVEPVSTNIIFQSNDGGQTWQDISVGLPEQETPQGLFAGSSDIYLRVKNEMYRSNSNLNTPVWEKENTLDPRITSIAFNRSGVTAYNNQGQIFQKISSAETWSPVYMNFKNQILETVFETSDGTIFAGCRSGLYKSADKGRSWKQVIREGWVMDLVESEGVLIGTSQKGIMRSADHGEHWEWVINEGGVGIAVERIHGGFAAISYNTSTKSRRIRISLDGGKTWNAIDDGLRPSLSVSSIKQMGGYLLCGHPDGIFRSADMGKTWKMVHASVGKSFAFYSKSAWNIMSPTYDGKVFKIYVSGSVLYAVAGNAGC